MHPNTNIEEEKEEEEEEESNNNSRCFSLELARVTSLPNTVYYIPNFITEAEEAVLLDKIASVPKPKWTHLSHRRLQSHPSPLSKTNTLLSEPLPSWLSTPIIPRMQRQQNLGIWRDAPHGGPNHVLVNEYAVGEGIMPHEDGPAYFPVVGTVSLGGAVVLDIFEKGEGGVVGAVKFRILQEARSLLVTTDEMYTSHLHGIEGRNSDEDLNASTIANWDLLGDKSQFLDGKYDRKVRTSLTYRDVLKVSKIGNNLFKRK